MIMLALSLISTAFVILLDEGVRLPVGAGLRAIVIKDTWFPSKILPVMSIHARCLIMVLLIKRTPLGLKVMHPKITILLHVVNESCFKLLGRMGEAAVVRVLAFLKLLGVAGAVLGFVLLWVVD